jgi:hypothetical protein
MFLGVPVDVDDQPLELGIGSDFNSTERALEQGSSPLIGQVHRLGIGVEQIREPLAGAGKT